MRALNFRLFVPVLMLAGALALACGGSAKAAPTPVQFVQDLGDKALGIVGSTSMSAEARKTSLSNLFFENFDVPYIGRFVLGRYWRTATDPQKADYLKAFGPYVVAIYADRFTNYGNVKFTATGQQSVDQKITAVESQVDRGGGAPLIHLEWRLEQVPTGYKITDVVAENLSLSVTKRDEFASFIENHGGDVQQLIDMLKTMVAKN